MELFSGFSTKPTRKSRPLSANTANGKLTLSEPLLKCTRAARRRCRLIASGFVFRCGESGRRWNRSYSSAPALFTSDCVQGSSQEVGSKNPMRGLRVPLYGPFTMIFQGWNAPISCCTNGLNKLRVSRPRRNFLNKAITLLTDYRLPLNTV